MNDRPNMESRDGGPSQEPSPDPQANPPRRRFRILVAVGVAAILAAGAGAATAQLTHDDPSASGQPSRTGPSINGWMPSLPERPQPDTTTPAWPETGTTTTLDTTAADDSQQIGMVDITSTLSFGAGEAAGTGMILTSDGQIVTNRHVVEDATSIKVTIVATGKTYTAEVVGTDSKHDIAVLQLKGAEGLQTVDTDTSSLSKGDDVIAVGDANGDGGDLTAAEGTVTALRQPITVNNNDGITTKLTGLIEINADVVAGDSGGAVLDSDGDVAGMTTAASNGTADIHGYAIPIQQVLTIVDRIHAGQESGSIQIGADGFLGVQLDTGTSFGGNTGRTGVTITGVIDDSPATHTGLQPGDTITAIDGEKVTDANQLEQAIANHGPGAKITVKWTDTTGVQHTGTATLTDAPVD